PGPSPIGPTLGTQVTNAFTWYDNTQGKEVVFATTLNSIFSLIDDTWTQVPFEIAPTTGMSMSFSQGAFTAIAYAVSPTSQTANAGTTSYTFGTFSAILGQAGATAYNWFFGSATGGTFSVSSGQGTAHAIPKVTGVTLGGSASANFFCTITFNGHTYTTSAAALSYTAFAPVLHTYSSGSGTETVPAGANTVVIEVWGGGGGGEGGDTSDHTFFYGQGGDSGTYCRSSYTCAPGQTLRYSVGTGGTGGTGGNFGPPGSGTASSVSSGSLGITTMSSPGGNTEGSPSGGNQANTAFNAGSIPGGGAAIAGVDTSGAGAGGDGGYGPSGGASGGAGKVSFYYTHA